MDPYLENPQFWSETHHRLITAIAIVIALALRPKYQVAIEKRTYLSSSDDSVLVGIPDTTIFTRQSGLRSAQPNSPIDSGQSRVTFATSNNPIQVMVPLPEEVRESYLEIREGKTGTVIAVVELLSPKNKRAAEGRIAYTRKRQQVLASITHLIEIDLLRLGEAMPILGNVPPTEYRILVSRSDRRPHADLYAFGLHEEIPPFSLPLQSGDLEPVVELQRLLDEVYDQAGYDLRIDYSQGVVPPLPEPEAAWVDDLLRSQGLRAS
jgi:hypothetical protein